MELLSANAVGAFVAIVQRDQDYLTNPYVYNPNAPANAVALAVMSLGLVLHIGFGIYYRQYWFGITFCSGLIRMSLVHQMKKKKGLSTVIN